MLALTTSSAELEHVTKGATQNSVSPTLQPESTAFTSAFCTAEYAPSHTQQLQRREDASTTLRPQKLHS